MAKKQTESVTENQQPLEAEAEVKQETVEIVEEQPLEAEVKREEGITDAAILGDSIYFIKGKKAVRKGKDGKEKELFDFNCLTPAPSLVTIEGFYLDKLVFLVDGKLVYLTDRSNLGLLAE